MRAYHGDVLLVLHLDSESLDWLDEELDGGGLPNLRRLIADGQRFPLEAAILPGADYPTIYSGRPTTDVGDYFPVQWVADKQALLPWTRRPRYANIFERIDRAGARIVVLDPPECLPVNLTRGCCISGLQFRARVLLHPWATGPGAGELMKRAGRAERADEVFGHPTAHELARLRHVLLGAPSRLGDAALHVLRTSPPDCLWVNCCAMHTAAHQFFSLDLLGSAPERPELENTRHEVARAYDEMFGKLLEASPPQTDVLVFYGKGMHAAYGWADVLPVMLSRVLGER